MLQRLWSFILVHGLLFLASSAIFLIQQGGTLENRLFILALFLLGAAVVQGVIVGYRMKKNGWKKGFSGGSITALLDLVLFFFIIRSPDASLEVYVAILALWAAVMGLSLLFHFGVRKPIRAHMTAAGIAFLILGGYLLLNMSDPKGLSYELLGILSLIFSVFLIYVAFQFKGLKKTEDSQEPTDDSQQEETEKEF